ncbi:MAG: PorV/PorQ family protein [Bacteroidia bacterium]|nr:PorV/PorQ family protein [Bacteroidia bacterium]MCX7763779.1 PorV/PorQ family protein [Bacteroidia bacterium]MDW8057907.1 PorV/PorQ family protein [Bacteroidia bacterium]
MRQTLLVVIAFGVALAGNPERAGSAGATQLLINPYARSSGMGGLNIANTYGIESVIINPAGIALTRRTEFLFSHTRWLVGSDISINAFGFAQGFKNGGTLGIAVMAFDLGQFERTTIDNPDGGIGYFSPTFLNISLSYAKVFADERIFVGATAKLIHESIPDAAANGVALDAGVQYRDKKGNLKLGVALRNIGPQMKYRGEGLAARTNLGGASGTFTNLVHTPVAAFEIPSVLLIGAAYRIGLGGETEIRSREASAGGTGGEVDYLFSIVPMIGFYAHSFQNNQLGGGLELRYKNYVMLRGAYLWEPGVTSKSTTQNAFTGISVGATVELPFRTGENRYSSFGIDYSYRPTYFFNGTHSIGARLYI